MQRARNSCCVKDHCGALRPPLAKDVSRHPPVVPTSAVRCTSRAPVHCGHSFPTPQTTLTSGTITKRQLRTSFPPHPALRPPAIPPFPAPNTLCLPPLSADMQCFRQCGCVGACSSASTTVARQPPLWPGCIRYGPRPPLGKPELRHQWLHPCASGACGQQSRHHRVDPVRW